MKATQADRKFTAMLLALALALLGSVLTLATPSAASAFFDVKRNLLIGCSGDCRVGVDLCCAAE